LANDQRVSPPLLQVENPFNNRCIEPEPEYRNTLLARCRGLALRVKIHVQEIESSNPGPAVETIYHAPLIWIKKHEIKLWKKITWHCCMCCYPAKGEGGV